MRKSDIEKMVKDIRIVVDNGEDLLIHQGRNLHRIFVLQISLFTPEELMEDGFYKMFVEALRMSMTTPLLEEYLRGDKANANEVKRVIDESTVEYLNYLVTAYNKTDNPFYLLEYLVIEDIFKISDRPNELSQYLFMAVVKMIKASLDEEVTSNYRQIAVFDSLGFDFASWNGFRNEKKNDDIFESFIVNSGNNVERRAKIAEEEGCSSETIKNRIKASRSNGRAARDMMLFDDQL